MPCRLNVWIVKESVISEFMWMNDLRNQEYFQQAVRQLQHENILCRSWKSIQERDYRRFQRVLQRNGKLSAFYYARCALFLKTLLSAQEVMLLTRKEVLEIQEAVEECWDPEVRKCFLPLFKEVHSHEILVISLMDFSSSI